jgi:hypothetical protein
MARRGREWSGSGWRGWWRPEVNKGDGQVGGGGVRVHLRAAALLESLKVPANCMAQGRWSGCDFISAFNGRDSRLRLCLNFSNCGIGRALVNPSAI